MKCVLDKKTLFQFSTLYCVARFFSFNSPPRLAVIFFFSKYRPSISSALLHNQLFIPPFSEVREIMKGFVARNKVQRRFPGARVSEGEPGTRGFFVARPAAGEKRKGEEEGL